ncbi:MAG: Uma2 family endonuclease, partial [Pirellulaceae bacterium]|nr:Uma2 family endonuclease [Pirellulaceae bacterium]
RVEIPLDIRSLADFRRWTVSDVFPEKGRIDFIEGRIEVDMSPEDIFCHGALKSECARVLTRRVKEDDLGLLLIDATRVSSPEADLSCEPDIVFVSHEAIDLGRAVLVPKAGGQPGRFVEIEGPADLVVEIVSDTSVNKDTKRLPAAFFRAGVREFWLADARGDEPTLVLHRPGEAGFEPIPRDPEGFQTSPVLQRRFRLAATRDRRGNWAFDLLEEQK